MYYISSKRDNSFGVTDTSDGVEEFYPRNYILGIKNQVDIDGIDSDDNLVVVKPVETTIRLIKEGKIHLALNTMSVRNNCIGIRFKSKPTKGEMSFVYRETLNISRSGLNNYSYDKGSSKSYRSGDVLEDILSELEWYLKSGWTIIDIKSGRF